ncbi:hypothetical protein [Nitratireductor pacificus]|uniref:Transmembrane protein n=1 Tax=Nitratireductor pacificus pht-3B TaxID=391937 RepID=K2N599_9HYPH|nr:hypothetical protein [Nitratireductor pacificus]EKF19393.1 hypothetical protein NA2_07874 [Nitratireductor pacificus pht-3B]
MLAHTLSVLAYLVITFAVQASNHLVVNAAHYARQGIVAPEPIFAGGVASMLVQGAVLTFLYSRLRPAFPGVTGGLWFALLMGAFLGSYIALGEPSKYLVSSWVEWFAVEATASLLQFALFGLALGSIHERWGRLAT